MGPLACLLAGIHIEGTIGIHLIAIESRGQKGAGVT
jgi:hypothetical protein